MTGSTKEYIEYVLELLEPINAISSGRFFGGQGVSCDSVQFAMIMGNSLYFVVDDNTRGKYIDMGTECFWYTKKSGRINVKKYHEDHTQSTRYARGAGSRVACIEDPDVIRKILDHLDRTAPSTGPNALPEPRAPSQAGLFDTL